MDQFTRSKRRSLNQRREEFLTQNHHGMSGEVGEIYLALREANQNLLTKQNS